MKTTITRMRKRAAEAAPDTRETILSAAERTFSLLGYDGTSMRGIAETAGVAQALLHYHFQTKERLYEAVFERRSATTSGHRVKLLDDLLRSNPQPALEDVLRILFIPNSAVTGEDEGQADQYIQLVARVCVANDEQSRDIVARHFDPMAQAFIDALMVAVPGLRTGQAVWSYLFAFGMRIQSRAMGDRATRLCAARGIAVPASAELLIAFVAAGIRALLQPALQANGRLKAAPAVTAASRTAARGRAGKG
jgi:AcrR family transcriptional regulator